MSTLQTPVAEATTSESPLDLAALKARCLGNLQLVEKVLNTFTKQLDSDLGKLEQAIMSGDTETFALVAHRIKGMSANTEAGQLAHQAAIAEQAARDRRLAQLPDQVQRLRRHGARFAEVFEATLPLPAHGT